jgi:RNase H-like domain found in reverse transcriptase
LLGRHFYLLTDAKSLTFLKTSSSSNSKLMRWGLLLAEFDFSCAHLPGAQLIIPDYLSRNVDYTTDGNSPTL